MSRAAWYYVRPTDSLFVRGNLDFGGAGEHGSGPMPPPPSLFAGAFRSALLGRDAAELARFATQGRVADAALDACLGTPEQPGRFRVSWLGLAGEPHDGAAPQALLPLPADLLWMGELEEGPKQGHFARLLPRALPAGVQSAGALPLRATLQHGKQEKPAGGLYLRGEGLLRHLRGELPERDHAVRTKHVHRRDPRLGIGLDAASRSVEEGLLYTTEGHAFSPAGEAGAAPRWRSTGFLVALEGVDELLPARGHLRLGGDGRSAEYRRVDGADLDALAAPGPGLLDAIAASRRFRLVLRTPGLFPAGWLPPGVQSEGQGAQVGYTLYGEGFSARLACAAVGRREVVSGWDLQKWAPKAAEAAAPAGSVWWFDRFEGDVRKLAAWVGGGLRADTGPASPRHAEGWNQAWLAAWPQGTEP